VFKNLKIDENDKGRQIYRRVFRDEDTEWLFDLQLDRFESDDDEILGDLFFEDDADELIEVHVHLSSVACDQPVSSLSGSEEK
jgi:hypothetical protein